MADGDDDDATEGQGDALRSCEWVALLAERRDEGREFMGGGGGVRDEGVFMWMRELFAILNNRVWLLTGA
jgi:hypothetical protein